MSAQSSLPQKVLRLLRKMSGHHMTIECLGNSILALRTAREGKLICRLSQSNMQYLAGRGLIDRRGVDLKLSASALMAIKRAEADDDGFLAQHRTINNIEVRDDGRRWQAKHNEEESPLRALYRRKTKSGIPFLSQSEFEAGERLRRDFTFGALMPSITMQWQEKLGGSSGSDKADFSDQTLGARHRVNKALEAVGPELGSLLIDVCCFLKGMEVIERERGWPVRSAKIVLKTALIALERHYNPKAQRNAPPQYQALQQLQATASV